MELLNIASMIACFSGIALTFKIVLHSFDSKNTKQIFSEYFFGVFVFGFALLTEFARFIDCDKYHSLICIMQSMLNVLLLVYWIHKYKKDKSK